MRKIGVSVLVGVLLFPAAAMAGEDPICTVLNKLIAAARETPQSFNSLLNQENADLRIANTDVCKASFSHTNNNTSQFQCQLQKIEMVGSKENIPANQFVALYQQRGQVLVQNATIVAAHIKACLGDDWKMIEVKPDTTDFSGDQGSAVGTSNGILWTAKDGVNVEVWMDDARFMNKSDNDPHFTMVSEVHVGDGRYNADQKAAAEARARARTKPADNSGGFGFIAP
jgi:hypothetical protein